MRDEPRERDKIVPALTVCIETVYFHRRIDQACFALVSGPDPSRYSMRNSCKLVNARRCGLIPLSKFLHCQIQQSVFARMSAVEVDITPGVTHGCVHIAQVTRALSDAHPMRDRIAKRYDHIVLTQVKAFNGRGHQGQEQSMTRLCKWQSIEIRRVNMLVCNGRVRKRRSVIDQ